jgi:uncharacterized delta-60 repeat protein
VDYTFGTNGTARIDALDSVSDVVALADGRVIAVGPASATANDDTDFGVVRLTADGALDPTFGAGGVAIVPFDLGGVTGTNRPSNNDFPFRVAALPDGRVVVAGTADVVVNRTDPFEAPRVAIARLTADGALDPTFDGDGKVTFSLSGEDVFKVERLEAAALPDGAVVVTGRTGPFEVDFQQPYAARLTAAGRLDPDYGTGGRVEFDPDAKAVALDPAGRFVVVAARRAPSGSEDEWFARRFIADGSPDASFGTGGETALGTTSLFGNPRGYEYTVIPRPGGGYLAGAQGRLFGGSFTFELVSLTAGGTIDAGFGTGGRRSGGLDIYRTASFPDGRVVGFAPTYRTVNSYFQEPVYNALVWLTAAGQPDTRFGDRGQTAELQEFTPSAVRFDPAGRVLIPASGSDGSGGTVGVVTRLPAEPNRAPTATPVPNQTTPAGTAVGPVAFTVGDAETPAGQLKVTVTSSDEALFPASGVVVGGTGAGRTLTVTPAAGKTGSATLTVTVEDAGGQRAQSTFTVLVDAPSPMLVGYPQFAVGGATAATLYDPDRAVRYTAEPFPGFAGGVRVAAADFNADGVADLVVGTGPGRATQVRVLDGKDQRELFSVDPFEASFTGGVYVAAGDVNGDGKADLVITPDEGGGPRCRVFDGGNKFALLADFFGIEDPNFRGGARSAIGDVNGDGVGDLVVAAGFQGGPRVAAFSGKSLATGPVKLFNDFFAFEQTLRNGVFIAAGDVNGDGFADIIAGGGPGGGPRVTAFCATCLINSGGGSLVPLANFFGGDEASRGGIRVAVKNLDDDNRADLVVGAGNGVIGYLGKTITPSNSPPPEFELSTDGVFVG